MTTTPVGRQSHPIYQRNHTPQELCRRESRAGTADSCEESKAVTGTSRRPQGRIREGSRVKGVGCLSSLCGGPPACEHLPTYSLTSISNSLLQHRCGQLIRDRQVLGVP